MPVLNPAGLIDERVVALRTFHRQCGAARAELDISGGVDSAVMLGLLVQAIGPDQIAAVFSGIQSSDSSRDRARAVCAAFGVPLIELELSDLYQQLIDVALSGIEAAHGERTLKAIKEQRIPADPTLLGSIRSTLRAPVGRAINRMMGGGIRHGTGNECEDRWARFYQKGGDGEVDTNPIGMLSKGEVYQLARALKVPSTILTAAPSPDLWDSGSAHNDEDEFASYFKLDARAAGQRFYSYIDFASGDYKNIGLIERVNRFADTPAGETLFNPHTPDFGQLAAHAISGAFSGVPLAFTRHMLEVAHAVERRTRHKENPAIPTLGDRATLVSASLLSDAL